MKKINVFNWLSVEDIEKLELLKENCNIENVQEQLINFDRVFVYENTTKYELGEEVAGSLGIIDEENPYGKYFDYEKFADDLITEDDNRYFELDEDERYMYIDEICNIEDGILLGKMKVGFAKDNYVKLSKHEFACGWYWSYNHISNNGLSCGLSEYLDMELDEAFENTWLTKDIWDNYRKEMKKLGEVLGNKEDVDELGKKLDLLWSKLGGEYRRIEFTYEEE